MLEKKFDFKVGDKVSFKSVDNERKSPVLNGVIEYILPERRFALVRVIKDGVKLYSECVFLESLTLVNRGVKGAS